MVLSEEVVQRVIKELKDLKPFYTPTPTDLYNEKYRGLSREERVRLHSEEERQMLGYDEDTYKAWKKRVLDEYLQEQKNKKWLLKLFGDVIDVIATKDKDYIQLMLEDLVCKNLDTDQDLELRNHILHLIRK